MSLGKPLLHPSVRFLSSLGVIGVINVDGEEMSRALTLAPSVPVLLSSPTILVVHPLLDGILHLPVNSSMHSCSEVQSQVLS